MQEPTQPDLLPLDKLTEMADCLKVMAHPIRLRIVDILLQGDFSVGKIAELCEVRQHQACEHLRHMQTCGLLTSRRVGRRVYYSIASPHLPTLIKCVRDKSNVDSAPSEAREGVIR